LISKIIIIAFLLAIIWCLASSFVFLIQDKGEGDRVVWRLTWRIGLSMLLFVLIFAAYQLGWVKPSTPGPIGLKPPAEAPPGDG